MQIGKILQDDKTVEFYNIQEKDFLVCLPAKVRKTTPVFPDSKSWKKTVSSLAANSILTSLQATQGYPLRCAFGSLHPCGSSSRCDTRSPRPSCSRARHSYHARCTCHPIPSWRCRHTSNRARCLR